MAERRMFSKSIIDSDLFLDMPLSTQALYFHLSMRADDDGFVNNPKKIARMIGADDDSLKLLTAKQFIIPFESGIVVIRHWRVHNYIQKDRYKETSYTEEKKALIQKNNGEYILDTDCTQDVYKTDTQVSIGKYSIGKNNINMCAEAQTSLSDKSKSSRFIPPTVDDVKAYCKETGKPIDTEAFINYYQSNGWKVGRNAMKDWKAAVRNWYQRDYGNKAQSKETSYNMGEVEAKALEKYKKL